MKRRTLDFVFSVGGVFLAVLLLVLGLVLKNQADFAKSYVHDQLTAQKITFSPVTALTDIEKGYPCLVDNAGKLMDSGKQAECYANNYIGDHLKGINNGKTYSETSGESRAAAKAAGDAVKADPTAQATKDLQVTAAALSGKVETLFKGETLRGLLLTSYGFSIFGERADTAFIVCLLVAVVLFLASLAGFIHAFTTPKDKVVLANHES